MATAAIPLITSLLPVVTPLIAGLIQKIHGSVNHGGSNNQVKSDAVVNAISTLLPAMGLNGVSRDTVQVLVESVYQTLKDQGSLPEPPNQVNQANGTNTTNQGNVPIPSNNSANNNSIGVGNHSLTLMYGHDGRLVGYATEEKSVKF
jgi:hypothetical protein